MASIFPATRTEGSNSGGDFTTFISGCFRRVPDDTRGLSAQTLDMLSDVRQHPCAALRLAIRERTRQVHSHPTLFTHLFGLGVQDEASPQHPLKLPRLAAHPLGPEPGEVSQAEAPAIESGAENNVSVLGAEGPLLQRLFYPGFVTTSDVGTVVVAIVGIVAAVVVVVGIVVVVVNTRYL